MASEPPAGARATAVEQPPRSRMGRTVLGTLLGVGFVWWFLSRVELDAALAEIGQARPSLVVAAAALALSGFGVRIWRWRDLVAPLTRARLASLASAVFGGWAVTALLPGRLGEVARAVLLSRSEGIRVSAAFGTVVLERLIDALAVLLLVAAALTVFPVPAGPRAASLLPAIRAGAFVAMIVLSAVAIGLLFAHRLPSALTTRLRGWVERLPGPIGRLGWRLAGSFGLGLTGALRMRPTPAPTSSGLRRRVALSTLLLWTVICGVHVLLLRAFAIDAPLSGVPLLLFLITLGLSLPIPGGVGSYHTAVQIGLTALFGVPADAAAGYAIVSHAVTLVPSALIGVTVLAREGVGLSTVVAWSSSRQRPAG